MTADQVPPEAAAIAALLNSRAHGVSTGEVLRLLGAPEADVSDLLYDLRSGLFAVLTAAHDGQDTAPAWADFTARTSAVRFQQVFGGPAGAELRQTAGDPLAGRAVRAVAELVGSGRWSRLRLCANDTCRGAFYDTSRSRTQRWHSYETCGNKHNVAAYRARRSAPGGLEG